MRLKNFAGLRLKLLLICAILFSLHHNVEAAIAPENQIKVNYLIYLSEYTTWPDEKMQLPYFGICIATGSNLSEALELLKGKMVKARQLEILYDVSAAKLNSCHIFYVESKFNKKVFQQSLQKNDPILTVSSDVDFVKDGGVIEYYNAADKIKMRVNLKVMNQLRLMMSSKLLRLMDSHF
jgi:hypothetical protein